MVDREDRLSGTKSYSVFVLVSFVAAAPTAERGRFVYAAPDKTFEAVVVMESTGESLVDFQATFPKHTVLRWDERSSDGAHGRGIVKAGWTSDSQFFIASTEASGGHQPWARPLWIYSREQNRVFKLSEYGATATDVFTLQAKDTVRVTILGCGAGGPAQALAFSPSRFLVTGRLPFPACQKR